MDGLKKLWIVIKEVVCCCVKEQEIPEKVDVKKIEKNNLDLIDNYVENYWIENRVKKVRFSGINYKSRSLKYFNNFNITLETIVEEVESEEKEGLKYLIFRILEDIN